MKCERALGSSIANKFADAVIRSFAEALDEGLVSEFGKTSAIEAAST